MTSKLNDNFSLAGLLPNDEVMTFDFHSDGHIRALVSETREIFMEIASWRHNEARWRIKAKS